jgi:D-proline reductase (dithiol) PrdB
LNHLKKSAQEPVSYIPLISGKYASQGYAVYQWVNHVDPPPWKPMPRPLSHTRLALAASGGIYAAGQKAFHYKDDVSFRAIPVDAAQEDLRVAHFAFDLTDARKDPNVIFPLAALKRLVQKGDVGQLTDHAFTFMGGIYSARRVAEELAPALAERILSEGAEAALLVPVCPVCHQTTAIVARCLEQKGVCTLCLTSALDITRSVNPPRIAFLDYPIGYICGKPGDSALQEAIVREALSAFDAIQTPGGIRRLPFSWSPDASWKSEPIRRQDVRKPRTAVAQYQCEEDRRLAEADAADKEPV